MRYYRLIWAAILILAEGAFALGAKLTYEEYSALGKEGKGRIARTYAEKNGQGYWEVGAYKYRVRTMISAECALETAIVMDRFYDEVSDIFGSRFHDSLQTTLYLFPDQESYAAFLASKHADVGFSSGMYIPEEHILAVCGGGDERGRREILFHEATHQILHAYTVKNALPVWFNEGMATNFQSWDVTKSRAENLRSAVALSGRRYLVVTAVRAGEMYSLKKLLSISLNEWNSSKEPGLNYAMAWSFTNFMLSTPENSAMMNQILEAIRKGTSLEKILSPGVVNKLEGEWHEDQKTRLMLYEEFIVPAMRLMMEKTGGTGTQASGAGGECLSPVIRCGVLSRRVFSGGQTIR